MPSSVQQGRSLIWLATVMDSQQHVNPCHYESHTIFKLSSCVFNRRFSLFVVFRPDKVILPFFIQLSEEEV